ncbi:MAG: MBL fold metallo-hydrolase [Phycisphaerales bacterium]
MRPRPAHPEQPREGLGLAARVARSGWRRYPAELTESIRAERARAGFAELRVPEQPLPDLGAAWLGHASVLVRLGGMWVLTDPVFSERIGVKLGPVTLGVARRAPAIHPDSLPPIDLIVLSHAHFDHLDRPTLARLASERTTVVTARHTRGLVPRGYGRVIEMPWNHRISVGEVEISTLPAAHWGARTVWDRHRGYNAYVLEAPRARVLFAGDTALTDTFRRVGGADLTIFGIGAYDPWITKHASPEQVWAMHNDAGGRYLLPMHHSTFELSDEPAHEPMARLLAAAGGAAESVVGRTLGEFVGLGSPRTPPDPQAGAGVQLPAP